MAIHVPATYVALQCLMLIVCSDSSQVHKDNAVCQFDNLLPSSESISTALILGSEPKQWLLPKKIEEAGFVVISKARLKAVPTTRPMPGFRAISSHNEMQVLLKLLLGCPFCMPSQDAGPPG